MSIKKYYRLKHLFNNSPTIEIQPTITNSLRGKICSLAAKKGHLHILQWARQNNCPWDEKTCLLAAESGRLDVVQWIIENGCDWFPLEILINAVQMGHWHIAKWLLENSYIKNKNAISKFIYPELVQTNSFYYTFFILKLCENSEDLSFNEKTKLQATINQINDNINNYTDLCKSIQDIVKNYM
jgi:hypothetical protein